MTPWALSGAHSAKCECESAADRVNDVLKLTLGLQASISSSPKNDSNFLPSIQYYQSSHKRLFYTAHIMRSKK
ncbi:hypothetical protein IAQ61_005240, partial [Plenodomus lingam]|uniref:Uncharacterized protein n=1 Tax=Leptosphaeria maculans (strain JN3 / isolate v23.1.3 / race Av1-4-5-6-7-8) TaxID=985895 RepID=E5A7B2_LEPMJ